jgi:hypothetical protein
MKGHNHLKGMQIKAHYKKMKLAEVQLQSTPTNEHVCAIFLESHIKLVELFQISIERFNHHLTLKCLGMATLALSYVLTSTKLTRRRPS